MCVMLPILWRYAIQSYLRVFFLSVFAFIGVLFITRFKEIARFSALSSDWVQTGLFVIYQFPFILPMAIPISALIASLLLFQNLSRSHELTALRASGLSFLSLLSPLLLMSICLSFLNFSICAEVSPFCRRESKDLLFRETTQNPLLLLQRQQLIKFKDAYINMKVKNESTSAKGLVLVAHNESNQRLSLFAARKLNLEGQELKGDDVAVISHLPAKENDSFDTLIIENQSSMSTSAPALSGVMKKNRPRLEKGTLGIKMLRLKANEGRKVRRTCKIEIEKRISLSLSVFTFTFLGCAFGIEQGRTSSKKNLIAAVFLTLLALISYLLGKELKSFSLYAFFLPHVLILAAGTIRLRKIALGRL